MLNKIAAAVCGFILPMYRHCWPTDRFLWPAARLLSRLQGNGNTQVEYVTPHGFRMHLKTSDYPDGAMRYGVYEVATVRLLKRLLRPGDCMVDVGGNIGYISLIAALLIKPQGRIIAFEPVPGNARRLAANVDANGLGQIIKLREAAVSDVAGETIIYTFADDGESRHVLASMSPLYEQQQPHTVKMEVIDEVVDFPVRLIKIDVEGAEVGVIRGASQVIKRYKPHLLIENNPGTLKGFGHHFGNVLETIKNTGVPYEITNVDGWRRRTWSLDTDHASMDEGNLWFRPLS